MNKFKFKPVKDMSEKKSLQWNRCSNFTLASFQYRCVSSPFLLISTMDNFKRFFFPRLINVNHLYRGRLGAKPMNFASRSIFFIVALFKRNRWNKDQVITTQCTHDNVIEHRQQNWHYISDKWAHVSALWQMAAVVIIIMMMMFLSIVRLQPISNNNRNMPFLEQNQARTRLSIRITLTRQPKYKHNNNNKRRKYTPNQQNKYLKKIRRITTVWTLSLSRSVAFRVCDTGIVW